MCDLARAIPWPCVTLISNANAQSIETFNLGMGQGVTVLETIHAFEKVNGIKLNYTLADRREGDVVAIYSDYSRANEKLGWQPQYTIEDIMKNGMAMGTQQKQQSIIYVSKRSPEKLNRSIQILSKSSCFKGTDR